VYVIYSLSFKGMLTEHRLVKKTR